MLSRDRRKKWNYVDSRTTPNLRDTPRTLFQKQLTAGGHVTYWAIAYDLRFLSMICPSYCCRHLCPFFFPRSRLLASVSASWLVWLHVFLASIWPYYLILIRLYLSFCVCRVEYLSIYLSILVCSYLSIYLWGRIRGVMANLLYCDIAVSEFEFRSRYYIHFRLVPLRKVWTPLSPLLSVELYRYCPPSRIVLVLNSPWRLICHWTKKLLKPKFIYLSIYLSFFLTECLSRINIFSLNLLKGYFNICCFDYL